MRKKTLLAAALLAWSAVCGAQAYPTRTITFVVPGPPGGATDVIARTLAEDMGKRLGQTIIVDNKPGAAGMLAVQTLTRAAPDGYTLLVTHSTPLMNTPYLYSHVPYDVRRDLAFVSEICIGQIVLVVNNKVPVKNMQEFLDWAAQNKGKVSYGSYGVGSMPHLLGTYLNQSRGLDMTHIAYKGEAPMVQDMLGGNVAWAIGSVSTLGPQIQSGRLRPLAIVGKHRVKELPNVPTLLEAGLKDQELTTPGWVGLVARAGTPAPVLARLEAEARASVNSAPMKERFESLALEPVGSTAQEFKRDFETFEPVMGRLIRSTGVKAD
ncbi:Bug family tripartite tricarboxylate transporter substrate binding protein [Cupriavidus sp. 2TAF22]|uniref:Bug family tripartite tricarboxylate transporter substrate binding protein n=1 Tax=unclassified Cupriavidus TaxID=2640874 RepID=UPI003F905629